MTLRGVASLVRSAYVLALELWDEVKRERARVKAVKSRVIAIPARKRSADP